MKKIIKKLINFFGYNISKNKNHKLTFDDLYKKFFLEQKLVIFDVGANKGQSIERFLKLFPHSNIHAFEPINKEFENLEKKYKNFENIVLNNFALGDSKTTKELNLSLRTGISSFNNFNKDHEWIKTRSKEYNTDVDNFLNGKQTAYIDTLDNYCVQNSINQIDILKIDTQGYEDLVLKGSYEKLNNNMINSIELEIIFDETYNKYLTFTDVEKFLLPNYRILRIKNYNHNLFEGINFFVEVLYLNKIFLDKKIKLSEKN